LQLVQKGNEKKRGIILHGAKNITAPKAKNKRHCPGSNAIVFSNPTLKMRAAYPPLSALFFLLLDLQCGLEALFTDDLDLEAQLGHLEEPLSVFP
jgi:hypothetical protein